MAQFGLKRSLPPEALAGVLGPTRLGLARLLPELAPAAGTAGTEVDSAGGLAGADMQKAQLLELALGLLNRLSATRPVVTGRRQRGRSSGRTRSPTGSGPHPSRRRPLPSPAGPG